MATTSNFIPDVTAKVYAAGDSMTFGPDPRFKLGEEASVLIAFEPRWKLDPSDLNAGTLGRCLLQIGTRTSPGDVLDIRLSNDQQALLFSSSNSTSADPVTLDCRQGAVVMLFFSQGKLRVFRVKSPTPLQSIDFNLGQTSGNVPLLRLGGSGGSQPFSGAILSASLFDRDIYADLVAAKYDSDLLAILAISQQGDPFAAAGLAKDASFGRSFVGLAVQSQNRFDFFPREIVWPEPPFDRWMLNDGDMQPIKVKVSGVPDDDHCIHSTNELFCFVRADHPTLRGTGGQPWQLAYLGDNRFSGHAAPGSPADLEIALTYVPDPANAHCPATMLIDCIGWDNNQRRMFGTRWAPQFTEFPPGYKPDTLWPSKFWLKRIPADYKDSAKYVPGMDPTSQTWNDAFSKSMAAIGAIMEGWDFSKIENPLNPHASTTASKDTAHYVFDPPASNTKDYRTDGKNATPYYFTTFDRKQRNATKSPSAYRSASEYAEKNSFSFGTGLSILGGKESSILNCSFESVRNEATEYTTEHSLVVEKSVYFDLDVVLEQQWLHLNPDFLDELRTALAAITSVSTPVPPGQYGQLFSLFDKWGTHYVNAMTFGAGSYSIALIDEVGAMEMVGTETKTDVALNIPLDDFSANSKISWGNSKSAKTQASSKSELYLDKEIGDPGKDHSVPILMDLRPIIDLLQPPFMDDTSALQKVQHLYAAMSQYYAERAVSPVDGFVLYQARLVSIANLNPDTSHGNTNIDYVTARMFMAATAKGSMDVQFPPAAQQSDPSLRLWYGDKVQIQPQSTMKTKASDFAALALPLSRTDLVPMIGVAGSSLLLRDIRWIVLTDGAYQSVDSLGTNWLAWNWGTTTVRELYDNAPGLDPKNPWHTASHYLMNAKLDLPSLPNDGTLVTHTTTLAGGLSVTFELRKVDMVDCFKASITGPATVAPTPP